MKKEIAIAAASLLIITTPVFATAHGNSNGNGQSGQSHGNNATLGSSNNQSQETHGNNQSQTGTILPAVEISPTLTPTAIPTPSEGEDDNQNEQVLGDQACDPSGTWKNHGEYVSCVAHLHLGGEVTSAAARSDIGKHHGNFEPSPTATPSPTTTETPTPTPTGEPITSAQPTLTGGISPLASLGNLIGRFLGFLSHLKI